MNRRTSLFLLVLLFLSLFGRQNALAQATLDDVRQDMLQESMEEIKSISDEIKRKKELLIKEREEKKKAFQERIQKAKKLEAIKTHAILSESKELLAAIKERTKFDTEKRWRYEELIKIYAEKPIAAMSLEEQEEAANQMLASGTSELIKILKQKAIQEAKRKRGEEYEEIKTSQELIVQLNQYTQLAKLIESYKGAQPEQIVKRKESVVRSTKELIDLLKEEAIRRAKLKAIMIEEIAEEKMQLKKFEGTLGLHYGYEDNINADKGFEGGLFMRNYVSVNWVPSFNRYLKGELGTWYLADNFSNAEDEHVTFRIAAGQTSLKWHPFADENLVIQPGYEFSDTYYPNDASLATKESKVFLNTKHKFWEKWSQELNYEDSWISYSDNRLSRDGAGNNRPGVPLDKRRHSIEYKLKLPLTQKTTFTLKQKGSRQTSNSAYIDFYDYYTYKVTGELARSLTQKLYAKSSIAYEQKDYSQRTVSAHQMAQEDRTYTQKITLFYFLHENWLLNYTWTRTKVDSNDANYDYEKMTHVAGVYYSF